MQAVAVLTNGVMSTSRADSELLRHFSLPVSHYLSTVPRAFGSTGGGSSLKTFRSPRACVLATNGAVICKINNVSHSINACLSPPEVNMMKRNARSLAPGLWMSPALSL